MRLPEGLTIYHIEEAVKRGDHYMTYRGSIVNVDELWKMIQEESNVKEGTKQDGNQRGRFRKIQEQSEESI